MKKIVIGLFIILFSIVLLFNSCISEDDKIDYYVADTTLSIWSNKFNKGISEYISYDTIILGVDSFLTWSRKVNTFIDLQNVDTIDYGVDDFEHWRTTFNTSIDSSLITIDDFCLGDSATTGNDVNMITPNNWITSSGGLSPDFSTTPGYMTLNFTSGNQAVRITDAFSSVGDEIQLIINCRKIPGSGDDMALRIGRTFQTTLAYDYFFDLLPDTIFREYKYTTRAGLNNNLYVFNVSEFNTGANFEIDYIAAIIIDTTCETNESQYYDRMPISKNTGNLIDSLQAFTGDLAKFGIIGNSIMANYYGGVIPAYYDEGDTERPPRLTTNNVSRRIYDTIFDIVTGYNKAIYRRSDHTDFTLSGVWTEDGGEAINASMINPEYTATGYETAYNYTTDPGAYAEIIIPDGYENAAIIFHRGDNNFTNINQDTAFITLNSGSIALYGDTLINAFYDYGGTGYYRGDPFAMSEYYDLPAGANTIRITNGNDNNTLTIWGVMYWTGRTIVVLNYSMAGYSMDDYWRITPLKESNNLNNPYVERNMDFILWEMPGINENTSEFTLDESIQKWELISNALNPVNYAVVGTHPIGCSDVGCSVNNYTIFDIPVDLEERYNKLQYWSLYNNYECYNIFRHFKFLYNENGYSLINGGGAVEYTTDGVHLNEAGAEQYVDYLLKNLLK